MAGTGNSCRWLCRSHRRYGLLSRLQSMVWSSDLNVCGVRGDQLGQHFPSVLFVTISYMIETPNSPKADVTFALLKAAVSEVPGGTLAAEVLGLFNPLEKRKQRWMEEITAAVNEITLRLSLEPSSLQHNAVFVSFLYQATTIAMRNHQQAKLDALRHTLIAVASNQVNEDMAFQFLRYVDELTSTHLALLSAIAVAGGDMTECKQLELIYSRIKHALPDSLDRMVFRAFLQDLDSRFLLRINDLEDFPEYESTAGYVGLDSSRRKPLEITVLGKSFLAFVTA
jgi:hypothetical protein